MSQLILASTSPYRRALLARLGLPFTTVSPAVDETPEPAELPGALAARLARLKATSVRDEDALVIGADQVAELDAQILGKPGTVRAALAMLEACRGREVVFHTAVAVSLTQTGALFEHVDITRVRFRRLRRDALEHYLEREPAIDCAGGFKAEGLGIALFEAIESQDPTALIGLPLIWLARTLAAAGLDPLGPRERWTDPG